MIFRALSTLIKRQTKVYSSSFYHFSSQPEQVEACKNEQKHAFFDPSWSFKEFIRKIKMLHKQMQADDACKNEQKHVFFDPLWTFEEFKQKNEMFYKQKQNLSSKKSRREGYFYYKLKWQYRSVPSEDWRNLKLQEIEKQEQFKILDDKTIYKGQFYEGKPHGLGINFKFSGQCYKGEWVKGQREGNGKQICQKGVYEGTFKNNLRHGLGNFSFAGIGFYSGEWENGKENGLGKRLFQNGQYYQGYFKDGIQEGIGQCHLKDQSNDQTLSLYEIGVWKNGELFDIIRQRYTFGQHEGSTHKMLSKQQVLRYYPEYQEQVYRLMSEVHILSEYDFHPGFVNDQQVLSDEEKKLRKGNARQSQFYNHF